MTGLTKILIGTAVAVGVGVTIAVVAETKKEKEQKEVVDGKGKVVGFQDKTGQITNKDEKDKSFIEKIKAYVKKKVIKILAFVALHMEQFEAAGRLIGLASGIIGIATAVRDFAKGNDTQAKLDAIDAKLDNLSTQVQIDAETVVHNQKILAMTEGYIAEATGVNTDEMLDDLKTTSEEYVRTHIDPYSRINPCL